MYKEILRRPIAEDAYVLNRDRGQPDWMSILDEFSQVVFRDSVNLWPVDVNRTKKDFDLIDPELLFVESAWNGNRGAWLYLICKGTYEKPELGQLIAQCREKGLPTVFWNKEDPVHFDDFSETAGLFDYVFTSDEDLVATYAAMPNVREAHLLQFCANTAIHNPRKVEGYRDGDICFAGQYFKHKYPERREQMEILFPAAARYGFTIFSRFMDSGDDRYQFPEEYGRWIEGSLPYSKMVEEYKRHKIFLNVNSVVTSSSMCARRVFELTAAKTIVVSCPSEAISNVFSRDEVPFVENSYEAALLFDDLLGNVRKRREIAQRAWRRTVRSHTSADRVNAIREVVLSDISMPKSKRLIISSVEGFFEERLLDELFNQSLFRTSEIQDVYLVSSSAEEGKRSYRGVDFHFVSESYFHNNESFGSNSLFNTYAAEVSHDFQYGPFYLEDLYLQLTKVGPEHTVTKANLSLLDNQSGEEECSSSSVKSGLWMADEHSKLMSTVLGISPRLEGASSSAFGDVYVTDPMNYEKVTK